METKDVKTRVKDILKDKKLLNQLPTDFNLTVCKDCIIRKTKDYLLTACNLLELNIDKTKCLKYKSMHDFKLNKKGEVIAKSIFTTEM